MTDDDAALAANAAYYAAFAEGDVEAMDRLWAVDGVSCVHPGWPMLIGRQPVLESYRNILRNADRERIVHRQHTVLIHDGEARVLCVEVIAGTDVALAATNLFRRIGGVWRMTHHQASPIATLFTTGSPTAPPSQRLN